MTSEKVGNAVERVIVNHLVTLKRGLILHCTVPTQQDLSHSTEDWYKDRGSVTSTVLFRLGTQWRDDYNV